MYVMFSFCELQFEDLVSLFSFVVRVRSVQGERASSVFVLSVPSGLAVGNEWLSLFCVGCDLKAVFLFSFHGMGEQSSPEDSLGSVGFARSSSTPRGP